MAVELFYRLRGQLFLAPLEELRAVIADNGVVCAKPEELDRGAAVKLVDNWLLEEVKGHDKGATALMSLKHYFEEPKAKEPDTDKSTDTVHTVKAEQPETAELAEKTVKLKLDSLRKDFKLSGQISDSSGSIGYMSFLRQVGLGKERGYTDPEIIDGIIRAIHPAAKIRGYLEGREDLTLPRVQTIIRSFYREKSSTELYQELCTLTQGERETTQDFIYRALELRQKIVFASKENTSLSYEVKLVEEQFRHTVATGLRDDNIRAELQSVLAVYETDEALLDAVNDITQKRQERQMKMGSAPAAVKVQSATHLQEDIVQQLKALRVEVSEMKRQGYGSGEHKPRGQPRGRKCSACQDTPGRCTHCYGCGSGEHYRRDCPEN
jgi:hypothetical protein